MSNNRNLNSINIFKKNLILKYESSLEEYQDSILPAKKFIPEWYKKIPKWENNVLFDLEKGIGTTVKQCVPFLDSMTTGYMITLPYDLYVKNNNGAPYITWPIGVDYPPKYRQSVSDQNIVPFGHFPIEYTWDYNVAYTFPKGYSALFTHPLNRHDLPFTTLSGIIDGGLVLSPHGNIPFFIKQGFEGVIPQGTPIAQLILFRQENWKSKKTPGLVKLGLSHEKKALLVLGGWYKKTFWVRKQYD
jgi:hypothetical protein